MLYILDAAANLISQRQIYREGRHHLEITPHGISIRSSGIIAKLVSNNLYLVRLTEQSRRLLPTFKPDAALTAINKDTIKMWHACLGHLGEQNIRRLATMSEGMDLYKSLLGDACIPCTVALIQTEPHNSAIQPGRHFLELVHSDVIGPFQLFYSGKQFAVTFLDDFHKNSKVYFLV